MHGLCRTAFVASDSTPLEQALELAGAAFKGFVHRSASGDVVGIYWKMSTDLSRPLTFAMGLHDALDGVITLREVQHASAKIRPKTEVPDLTSAIENARGAIALRQRWSRGQVETRLANMPPCLIGMEACVGAHHLSRRLKTLGHDAPLMPAK